MLGENRVKELLLEGRSSNKALQPNPNNPAAGNKLGCTLLSHAPDGSAPCLVPWNLSLPFRGLASWLRSLGLEQGTWLLFLVQVPGVKQSPVAF